MNRFGSHDYDHPVFPPFSRSYHDPPDIYPFTERTQPLYDDFDVESWVYNDYHRSVDSGFGDHISRSRSWVPEDDPRRRRPHLFSRSGRRAPVSPDPSKETRKNRDGNKFDRFFGKRRRDRSDLHGEQNARRNGPEYDDIDAASLDSFAADDGKRRNFTANDTVNDANPERFDVRQEYYLRQFQRERAKIRRECHRFQELKTGLEDLLRSWNGPEGIVYGSAPYSADARCHTDPFPRSPQAECPQSAATDPGPGFYTRERSPGFEFDRDNNNRTADIDRYNEAWDEAKALAASGGHMSSRIPWPTKTLRAKDLLRNEGQPPHLRFQHLARSLPSEISEDPYLLQKWNAFSYFLNAFGLRATYTLDEPGMFPEDQEDGSLLVFDIEHRSASKVQLEKLKSQLNEEKLRWHPDARNRLRLGNFSEFELESAKAVFDAILDASRACKRCLAMISRS